MTDPTRPRNTLTLKKKPATDAGRDDSPRKRSGGRARKVAQAERERGKYDALQRQDPQTAARPTRHSGSQTPQRDDEPVVVRAPVKQRRPERQPRYAAEIFTVFAPCPHGLEAALCAELEALGFEDARADRAGCRLTTNWSGIQRINLYSRLATRVLVQVAHAPVHNEDDILELARHTPWERWFGPEQTLRVDTSAIRSPMKSLQYCNLRAKDGICDRLREREGERPDIDTVRPDARVHLFLDDKSATLYLDTSGESLFKRGWRLDKGEAPIRENLAAGILALAEWDPEQALLDPFCGSGTILIEAAWIALGVPPGIWRPFAFERLRNHDPRHWRDLKTEAREHIRPRLETPLIGVDLDETAIESARNNVERAHLAPDTIHFEVGDARHVKPPAPTGWLVTNPPYGERLSDNDKELWSEVAANLKQNFSDWHVHIITSDLDLPQHMRLKPRRRHPLHNGALECRLFGFEMVKAGYRR